MNEIKQATPCQQQQGGGGGGKGGGQQAAAAAAPVIPAPPIAPVKFQPASGPASGDPASSVNAAAAAGAKSLRIDLATPGSAGGTATGLSIPT